MQGGVLFVNTPPCCFINKYKITLKHKAILTKINTKLQFYLIFIPYLYTQIIKYI